MSISSPIDVVTPATRRRQALAQQLQQQYSANRGGQKQMQALNAQSLHALPLFRGSGSRDSVTLPSAPQPQLTVPFMQDPGTMQNLGVVNPASPQDPNVSQGPGQGAPGPNAPNGGQPDLGVTQSQDPNAQTQQRPQPQAGQGLYADGSPAPQPIMDPNMLLQTFSGIGGVRRLVGMSAQQQQPNMLAQMISGMGNIGQSGQRTYL